MRKRKNILRNNNLDADGVIGCGIVAVLWVICVFIAGTALYYLWNWIAPTYFNGPTLGYWQSVGITFLVSLLRLII